MKSQSNVKETKSGAMAYVKYTFLVDSILSKMCKCFGMITFCMEKKYKPILYQYQAIKNYI